ncbi:MAG TPA: phosphate ABC transporter permease PstA [Bacteroidetes bacterium]|nr:phosphate ABC transporter permease PstA [Bacteroidota bacterium]
MKKTFFTSGTPFIWLTGLAAALGLLMIVGLLLLILVNGLGIFWPQNLQQFTLKDGSVVLGEVWEKETHDNYDTGREETRYRIKTANRDFYGLDFRWLKEDDISERQMPPTAWVLERQAWGQFFGFIIRLSNNGVALASDELNVAAQLPEWHEKMLAAADEIHQLEKGSIGSISMQIENMRLEKRKVILRRDTTTASGRAALRRVDEELASLERQYQELEKELMQRITDSRAITITLRTIDGQEKELPLIDVVRMWQPNRMSAPEKAGLYAARVWEFLSGEPREANMEGGVFPAIFGTVLMVILMSIAAVPIGVLTAVYLREYAKQGPVVRAVRIAVNNMAGVPSIVYGIFGLGFFVYTVGGTIDQLFYSEALPSPTFGTGGILWASLTLALLTLPVVVVATEEGLAAVPRSIRDGSLALGATKFETLWRIILPSTSPAILTGTILAIARAAGEVAPLMVTGVVKLAPSLPLDSTFPYLHLERKFMHLGFHIYDVGFQSPNVEAALPIVYATTLLLVLIILTLNLTAILLRNRLYARFSVTKI